MIEAVDPFIGTDVTDLSPPKGLAAAWWWPKPQIGNTHPGATAPLGMVSACPYSGAYPTGYGRHHMSTEGIPATLRDRLEASGFTHFQQSGTGAIRKYYNYFRVSPMLEPLDALDTRWALQDETAEPGYYAASLDTGIRCELTVGPKSAIHRYTFPTNADSRLVVDFSLGGLDIEHGRTVPMRASLASVEPGVLQGEIVVEGVPLSVHVECDTPGWRQMLWYDRRLMAGSSRLDFDSIRQTTLRPFGAIFIGPTEAGHPVELRMGFSLRGVERARTNLHTDCGQAGHAFDARRAATRGDWVDHLDRVRVEGGSGAQRTVFATALYHSLLKPCFAADESPFWPSSGAFVFDICTMWDIYKTQLPLLTALAPDRAVELVQALLSVVEEEGNLPIGYRMARGADRFFRQASALAHTFLADVCQLGLAGIDWDNALVHLHTDLRRGYGEEFLEKGVAHPITHTLDLAYGYHCTARVARRVGDQQLAEQLEAMAARWTNAFDPVTGLLVDSTYYEGGRWNYSFRLLHDMAQRIHLAGGDDAFVAMLDRFFGFGEPPVEQLGAPPYAGELAAGYALDRFEGLNNEPDMEAPWAYHYAGRPDRTAEIVHAVTQNQFGVGRGGLPGNDDSGGLSSWFVWATLGLFPVAGQNLFLVNAPAFRRSRLRVAGGEFIIDTTGYHEPSPDGPPQYVQSATLDGAPLDRSWIDGTDVHAGGHLVIDLGPHPSDWATDTRPPSHPPT
ncbi:GH92 family glycosyl hydrolase [Actinospongicola halichondriae]|uniref:GH92 family glycosyl hydrolase n=1 Tax=Actinospongicola halichondriae TaxID=3236844 RepID=UPI003D48A762